MKQKVKLTRVNEKSLHELESRLHEYHENCDYLMYQCPFFGLESKEVRKTYQGDGLFEVTLFTTDALLFVQHIMAKDKSYPCYMEYATIEITNA